MVLDLPIRSFDEYFIALPSRFSIICLKRPESVKIQLGTLRFTPRTILTPILSAMVCMVRATPSITGRSSVREVSITIFPASILDVSKISLMILSSEKAEFRIVPIARCCSSLGFIVSSTSIMPIMPLIGVRISWLMLARNSPLAFVAASALIFAM